MLLAAKWCSHLGHTSHCPNEVITSTVTATRVATLNMQVFACLLAVTQ